MLTLSGCRERQTRLRQALAERQIDAAVISDPHEIYYFTGALLMEIPFPLPGLLWIDAQSAWLIAPDMVRQAAVDELLTYEGIHKTTANADWNRQISRLAAAKLGGTVRRIGYQVEALPRLLGETIADGVQPDEWISLDDVIADMQKRKDADEIDLIRRCIQANLAAYDAASAAIQPGVNELEVLAAGQRAAMLAAGEPVFHGGDYASGALGGAARNRQIEAGELYIVDAQTRYRGYWSDLSRVFIVGDEISPLQQSIFDHCKAIHERVPELLVPGADGIAVWNAVDAMIREHPALAAGGLVHHAGHALGLRAHEMPDLNVDRGGRLEVGNVISVEPGGYADAARYGVRLENTYLITENGVENLSVYPMSLRPTGSR